MASTFSPQQIAALAAPLDRSHVRQREQGRTTVSYLEGWQVIAEANRIFGFDGWQRETVHTRCVSQGERGIGRDQKPGWGVTYTARVRITVGHLGTALVIREGSGAGHGIDTDLGQAHESAIKEAETDATKRALMTFGNAFGLALYDKQQRQVTGSSSNVQRPARPGSHQPAAANAMQRGTARPPVAIQAVPAAGPAAAPAAPEANPAQAPLDPATIQQLLATIRSLPRPVLEALSQGFRQQFAVPPDAVTIADRICQRQHHDWIEAFLVRQQQVSA
jgi:DNA recombination protein Rad52